MSTGDTGLRNRDKDQEEGDGLMKGVGIRQIKLNGEAWNDGFGRANKEKKYKSNGTALKNIQVREALELHALGLLNVVCPLKRLVKKSIEDPRIFNEKGGSKARKMCKTFINHKSGLGSSVQLWLPNFRVIKLQRDTYRERTVSLSCLHWINIFYKSYLNACYSPHIPITSLPDFSIHLHTRDNYSRWLTY